MLSIVCVKFYAQNMENYLSNIRTCGPLIEPAAFRDTKDPCPVFDGSQWHIYGSGGSSLTEEWKILHLIGPDLHGPWQEMQPAILLGVEGSHVAAPSVIYDPTERIFHMFIQRDFMALGQPIEHLTSEDGRVFRHRDSPLRAIPDSKEACLYDPHAAEIGADKYLTYSGAHEVGKPDIFLARSVSKTWDGPWERLGQIVGHEKVPFHNQKHESDYEWGLEGSQLIDLRNGFVLLNAVCFLSGLEPGRRQRVFFMLAQDPRGPYELLPLPLDPQATDWQSGENGHAAGVVEKDDLHLFYQARPAIRPSAHPIWRYGLASIKLDDLRKNEEVDPRSSALHSSKINVSSRTTYNQAASACEKEAS